MENNSVSQTLPGSQIVFPRNAFGVWQTLFTGVCVGIVLFAVIMASSVFWIAQHGPNTAELQRAMTGFYGVISQGIAEILIVVFLLLMVPWLAKLTPAQLGFRAAAVRDFAAVALGVIGMFILVNVLAGVLSNALHFKNQEAAMQVFTHLNAAQKVYFAIFAVVVAPIFEETVFRYFLFNAFRKWWGLWAGAIVSGALFGLAHAQPPVTPAMFLSISLPLAVGGVLLALVYEKTGKAWASMVVHGTFNAVALIAVVAFPQLAK